MVQWLISDAGAGWIFGLISLTILIVTRLTDNRPQNIVFKELRRVSPLLVRKNIQDKIYISYNGKEVSSIGQLDAEIYNSGKTPISSFSFNISIPEGIEILDIVSESEGNINFEINGSLITVYCNYINPFKEHKHLESISILATGLLQNLVIYGHGNGWSIKHSPIPSEASKRKETIITQVSAAFFLILTLGYGKLIEYKYGITMSEVSLRAFYATSPIFIFLGLFIARTVFILRR
jgi:hypothetical protein